MAFAIRRRSDPTPPFMAQISNNFPPLFSFAIESYIYVKRILHLVPLKNIVFKSSYNSFK